MKNQIIITLGREHGSGGHYIADMIAQELGIKLYDKDSICLLYTSHSLISIGVFLQKSLIHISCNLDSDSVFSMLTAHPPVS